MIAAAQCLWLHSAHLGALLFGRCESTVMASRLWCQAFKAVLDNWYIAAYKKQSFIPEVEWCITNIPVFFKTTSN